MKHKNLFVIASLCGLALMVTGCNSCTPRHHGPQAEQHQKNKGPHKGKKQQPAPEAIEEVSETVVFYQTYSGSDIDKVKGNIYTHSSCGGTSDMGTIKFTETDEGLKMKINLIDLRPGKTYTAQIYQCGACNDSTCCDVNPMAIDLPKIETNKAGRLEKSYIVRGLSAAQLNNAKIILTRDGGYKAAWGKLKQ